MDSNGFSIRDVEARALIFVTLNGLKITELEIYSVEGTTLVLTDESLAEVNSLKERYPTAPLCLVTNDIAQMHVDIALGKYGPSSRA